MKKILGAIVLLLLIISCSKEKVNLELFNPESFAYDLGNSWEVNAMVNLRGFEQDLNDESNRYEASVSFNTDLQTPSGEIIKDIFSDAVDFSLEEEIIDIPLEIQFELDSTFLTGRYIINLIVEDNFSGNTIEGVIEVDIAE